MPKRTHNLKNESYLKVKVLERKPAHIYSDMVFLSGILELCLAAW